MAFNINNDADVTKLRTEINTDPRGIGYAPFVNLDDGAIQKMLTDPRPGIIVNRPDIPPIDILGSTDITDFVNNANALAVAWFESATRLPAIPLLDAAGQKNIFRKNFDRIIGNASGSQTRFDAIAVRTGSRLEELYGAGSSINSEQVGRVLRG